MPAAANAFRLSPNHLRTGELATVKAEWAMDDLLNQPCTVELVELDVEGGEAQLVARFSATLTGTEGDFRFTGVQRQPLPDDDPDDAQLPTPVADTSKDGSYTYPREIAWRRAHFKLQLYGDATEHLVILRVADGRDPKRREGMRYELGLRIKDAGGQVVWDSGDQYSSVDCWDALIANCIEQAANMLEGHHGMCEARDAGGDYYGSHCGSPKQGATSTDCVTYILQVLDRAYAECRASADARYLRNNASYGSKFAPALWDAGWQLVLFVNDTEARLKEQDYYAGIYKTARDKGTLWGRPVEVVCDYQPNGQWDATTDTWTDPVPDVLMRERWTEIAATCPFGIVALGLGSHMVMKVQDLVYECHWSYGAGGMQLFDRGTQWDDMQSEGVMWMAAPRFGLLPPPLPMLEPIRPKPIEIQFELPKLELKPVPIGAPPALPPTRRRRRHRHR